LKLLFLRGVKNCQKASSSGVSSDRERESTKNLVLIGVELMLQNNSEKKQQLTGYIQEKSKNLHNTDLKEMLNEVLSTLESITAQEQFVLSEEFNLMEHLQQYEADIIRHALRLTKGNQIAASKLLGINYTTLNSKIKRYQLDVSEIDN
jgi:DNA-binding NtrC family response regulator